jgi:hypothetical protein
LQIAGAETRWRYCERLSTYIGKLGRGRPNDECKAEKAALVLGNLRALDDDGLRDVYDHAGSSGCGEASSEHSYQADWIASIKRRQLHVHFRKLDHYPVGVRKRKDLVVDFALKTDDEARPRFRSAYGRSIGRRCCELQLGIILSGAVSGIAGSNRRAHGRNSCCCP